MDFPDAGIQDIGSLTSKSCLILVAPIVGFCLWCLFCNEVHSVLSSFAIISLRKRELVALHFNEFLLPMWLSVICVSSTWCQAWIDP